MKTPSIPSITRSLACAAVLSLATECSTLPQPGAVSAGATYDTQTGTIGGDVSLSFPLPAGSGFAK